MDSPQHQPPELAPSCQHQEQKNRAAKLAQAAIVSVVALKSRGKMHLLQPVNE